MRLNGDDFKAKGPTFTQAWEILHGGCDIPPSLELFEHELEVHRKGDPSRKITPNPSLAPQGMARRLVERYHRTTMSFPDDKE